MQFLIFILVAYEDEGVAHIPIVRGPGVYGRVQVEYTTRDGTAVGGRDYIVRSTSVIFEDGQNEASLYLNIVNDEEREFDESLQVILTRATGQFIHHTINKSYIIINIGIKIMKSYWFFKYSNLFIVTKMDHYWVVKRQRL